ncbi:hypothetical protein L7F22_049636 [Adiantum nelumboides]|nr:hypothetical protein [Adiantum nelumboides]
MKLTLTYLLALMAICINMPSAFVGHVASAWSVMQKAASTSPDELQYYVQVGLGPPDFGTLIAPIDRIGSSGTFRETQLFAFDVTQGKDKASKLLGSLHGYAIQTTSTADFRGVEVEVLAYDDGFVNGTISLQWLRQWHRQPPRPHQRRH